MPNVTDWSEWPCPVPPEDKLSTGESCQRLPHFDDVGGEHHPRLGTNVQRVVRRAGWHEEGVTGVQGEGGLPLDHHLHRPGEDVANLLTRMHVPARLDAGWDLGEHLHDLPSGNRGWAVLELGALELPRERVDRLLRVRHGVGRHGWTS